MRVSIIATLCWIQAAASLAQTPAAGQDSLAALYIAGVRAGTTAEDRADLSDPLANSFPFLSALVDDQLGAAVIHAFEDARLTKQLGTSASSGGTTSIAVRGDSPSILGLALEHGVISGARTGESITFRGNLVGLLEAAKNAGFVASYDDDRPEVRALRRISFGVSFDPGNAEATSVDPSSDRLTAWSVRANLKNQRDPRDAAFRGRWTMLDQGERLKMLAAANDAMDMLMNEPAFIQWRETTFARVRAAADAELDAVLTERFTAFRRIARSEMTNSAVRRAVERTLEYLNERQSLVETVLRTPLVVLEYTNNRPLNEPRTSDIRLVAEAPLLSGSLVANAAVSLYDTVPEGAERIRHFDGSVQWDVPLGYASAAGAVVLTLATRLQYIQRGVTLQNALIPNTKGTIGVLQLKASIPIKQAGVQLPVSVTWANRTELVKEKVVRGQVGITFDFDSLVAKSLRATSN